MQLFPFSKETRKLLFLVNFEQLCFTHLDKPIFTNAQSLTRIMESPFERYEIINICICIYWACIPLKTDLKPIDK